MSIGPGGAHSATNASSPPSRVAAIPSLAAGLVDSASIRSPSTSPTTAAVAYPDKVQPDPKHGEPKATTENLIRTLFTKGIFHAKALPPQTIQLPDFSLPEKSPKSPYQYQMNAVHFAMEHNTIIYLPTGSGKTVVAAQLIMDWQKRVQEAEHQLRGPNVPSMWREIGKKMEGRWDQEKKDKKATSGSKGTRQDKTVSEVNYELLLAPEIPRVISVFLVHNQQLLVQQERQLREYFGPDENFHVKRMVSQTYARNNKTMWEKAAFGYIDPKRRIPHPPYSVFLCTAQTFQNAVDQSIVKLSYGAIDSVVSGANISPQIWANLVVLDECHHAHGKDPFAKILSQAKLHRRQKQRGTNIDSQMDRGSPVSSDSGTASNQIAQLALRMSTVRLVGLTATPGVLGGESTVTANILRLEGQFGGYIFTDKAVWQTCNRSKPILCSYSPLQVDTGGTSSLVNESAMARTIRQLQRLKGLLEIKKNLQEEKMKTGHNLKHYEAEHEIPENLEIDVRSVYAEYCNDLQSVLTVLKEYGPLPAYYALAFRIGDSTQRVSSSKNTNEWRDIKEVKDELSRIEHELPTGTSYGQRQHVKGSIIKAKRMIENMRSRLQELEQQVFEALDNAIRTIRETLFGGSSHVNRWMMRKICKPDTSIAGWSLFVAALLLLELMEVLDQDTVEKAEIQLDRRHQASPTLPVATTMDSQSDERPGISVAEIYQRAKQVFPDESAGRAGRMAKNSLPEQSEGYSESDPRSLQEMLLKLVMYSSKPHRSGMVTKGLRKLNRLLDEVPVWQPIQPQYQENIEADTLQNVGCEQLYMGWLSDLIKNSSTKNSAGKNWQKALKLVSRKCVSILATLKSHHGYFKSSQQPDDNKV